MKLTSKTKNVLLGIWSWDTLNYDNPMERKFYTIGHASTSTRIFIGKTNGVYLMRPSRHCTLSLVRMAHSLPGSTSHYMKFHKIGSYCWSSGFNNPTRGLITETFTFCNYCSKNSETRFITYVADIVISIGNMYPFSSQYLSSNSL